MALDGVGWRKWRPDSAESAQMAIHRTADRATLRESPIQTLTCKFVKQKTVRNYAELCGKRLENCEFRNSGKVTGKGSSAM